MASFPWAEALRLSDVLHTDPGQLGLLVGCIRSRQHWLRMTRPHRVLVFVATRIEGDVIIAASDARLAVEESSGKRSTFPRVHRGRASCVAGRLRAARPMKAYAQPCWSADDILPLDSGRERDTLNILVRFQAWMVEQGYAVGITKPLYDRAKYYFGDKEMNQA